MKKSQSYCLSTISSGEDLFQHILDAKKYGSMVHLGLMHYLSKLYEKGIKPPKKRKRVIAHHSIQLDITNQYTFV